MSDYCTNAYLQAYNPIVRVYAFYQALVSFSSILPLSHFLIFKLLKSTFHGNLKSIFVGYYLSLISVSVALGIAGIIQVLKPLLSHEKCHIILDPVHHKILNIIISFFVTLSTIFPFSITIERYFAMRNAEKYEKFRVIFGPILVAVNIFLNVILIHCIFYDEVYPPGYVSFFNYPPAPAQNIFTCYAILFLLNIIDVVFDIILLRQNLHLKKRLKNSSLSLKYQLEQVYESTKISVFIILVHIILFGIYVFCITFFRYLGALVISDTYNLFGVRSFASTMIPTYHLVIGIVSIKFFDWIKSKKSGNTTIQMSSTGSSGASNYDQAIFNIWNSPLTTVG